MILQLKVLKGNQILTKNMEVQKSADKQKIFHKKGCNIKNLYQKAIFIIFPNGPKE